jgi:MFS family permease
MMLGDFYCYDNPAALYKQLKSKFSSTMTPSQYETNFQLLYTAYALPNVILPFFGGYLVDRFGTRSTLLVFSAILAVAQCVFALGCSIDSFTVMLLGRVLFGLGGECLTVAQNVILTEWYKGRELAFSFGISLSFCRGGSVLNNNLSPYLADKVNLEFSLWFGAILCSFCVVCVLILIPIDLRAETQIKAAKKKAGDATQGEDVESGSGGDKGDEEEAEEEAAPVSMVAGVKSFGIKYWLMLGSCLAAYGIIQVFNNTASAFLLERDYFRDPIEMHKCCSWDPKHVIAQGADANCFKSEGGKQLDWDKCCTAEACTKAADNHHAPVLNLTSDQLLHLDCTKDPAEDRTNYGLYPKYNSPKVPLAHKKRADNSVNALWLIKYCNEETSVLQKAAFVMSIPYIINVSLSPFLGIAIDYYGRCATILVITPLVFLIAHLFLATSTVSAIYPLVGQGLAYSFYAAALWPMVVYVVEEQYVGVAYGVMTSILNFGTAVFPLITSAIYIKSDDKYVPNTEWFFVGLAGMAFICGSLMWLMDRASGRELDRSHWNDQDDAAEKDTSTEKDRFLNEPLLNDAKREQAKPKITRIEHDSQGAREELNTM